MNILNYQPPAVFFPANLTSPLSSHIDMFLLAKVANFLACVFLLKPNKTLRPVIQFSHSLPSVTTFFRSFNKHTMPRSHDHMLRTCDGQLRVVNWVTLVFAHFTPQYLRPPFKQSDYWWLEVARHCLLDVYSNTTVSTNTSAVLHVGNHHLRLSQQNSSTALIR